MGQCEFRGILGRVGDELDIHSNSKSELFSFLLGRVWIRIVELPELLSLGGSWTRTTFPRHACLRIEEMAVLRVACVESGLLSLVYRVWDSIKVFVLGQLVVLEVCTRTRAWVRVWWCDRSKQC